MLKAVAIGWVFLFLGVTTIAGTLFIIFFMKETKGKTQAEIDKMFVDDE